MNKLSVKYRTLFTKSSSRGAASIYFVVGAIVIFILLVSWLAYTLFLKPAPEEGGTMGGQTSGTIGGTGYGQAFPGDAQALPSHLTLDSDIWAGLYSYFQSLDPSEWETLHSHLISLDSDGWDALQRCLELHDPEYCFGGGEDGDSCAYNSNCLSNCCSNDICAPASSCGTDGGEIGEPCTQNNNCASGCCKNSMCVTSNQCTGGGEDGDSCVYNSNCPSNCCSNDICVHISNCGTNGGIIGGPCTQNNNCQSGCCKGDVCVNSSQCTGDGEDETTGWQIYQGYGFEIKYPQDWNLSSCSTVDPNNPGTKIYLYKGTNINKTSQVITVGITTGYPFSPDTNMSGQRSEKKIGGLDAYEKIWKTGYCSKTSCSPPFIILWTKYKSYFYTFVFNDTIKIEGIYDQILSTFKFKEF